MIDNDPLHLIGGSALSVFVVFVCFQNTDTVIVLYTETQYGNRIFVTTMQLDAIWSEPLHCNCSDTSESGRCDIHKFCLWIIAVFSKGVTQRKHCVLFLIFRTVLEYT